MGAAEQAGAVNVARTSMLLGGGGRNGYLGCTSSGAERTGGTGLIHAARLLGLPLNFLLAML